MDGYSRHIMILEVTTDNLARTAFNFYKEAVTEFSIPSKIRIDGGSEYNFIEAFMNQIDGSKRCIRGKSVHNTRIERLWRDCREKVSDKYISIFDSMERYGILDVDNDINLFALHFVFLPRIRRDLEIWKNAHNSHPVRTEKNKTPLQLWLCGSITNQHSSSSAMRNIFSLRSEDRTEAINSFMHNQSWAEPLDIAHVLSRITAPLSPQELDRLIQSFDPLQESQSNGVDIYGRVINFVHQRIRE